MVYDDGSTSFRPGVVGEEFPEVDQDAKDSGATATGRGDGVR